MSESLDSTQSSVVSQPMRVFVMRNGIDYLYRPEAITEDHLEEPSTVPYTDEDGITWFKNSQEELRHGPYYYRDYSVAGRVRLSDDHTVRRPDAIVKKVSSVIVRHGLVRKYADSPPNDQSSWVLPQEQDGLPRFSPGSPQRIDSDNAANRINRDNGAEISNTSPADEETARATKIAIKWAVNHKAGVAKEAVLPEHTVAFIGDAGLPAEDNIDLAAYLASIQRYKSRTDSGESLHGPHYYLGGPITPEKDMTRWKPAMSIHVSLEEGKPSVSLPIRTDLVSDEFEAERVARDAHAATTVEFFKANNAANAMRDAANQEAAVHVGRIMHAALLAVRGIYEAAVLRGKLELPMEKRISLGRAALAATKVLETGQDYESCLRDIMQEEYTASDTVLSPDADVTLYPLYSLDLHAIARRQKAEKLNRREGSLFNRMGRIA